MSRQYVFDLNIVGCKKLTPSHLENKIRLKSRGFFSKTEFNQRKLHLDEITLKNYYKTLGFIDVEISSSYDVFQDSNVNVNFEIIEGTQYFIKEINCNGIKQFSEEQVENIINLKVNEIYNPSKFRFGLKKLKYTYLQVGKINISIVEDIVFNDGEVLINILISEGRTYSLNNISILGLEKVNSKYVNREILISSGMIYNVKLVDKTRERIFESGLFSSVEIQPIIIGDSQLNIHIKLREYKSREVNTEIGFNQLPSTVGDLPISAVNTKVQWQIGQLFNTASSIRFNSEIGVSYGSDESFTRQYYEAYYTSPWLLKFRTPINFKIYYENIKQSNSLTKLGLNTSFNYYQSNNMHLIGSIKTEFISSSDISSAEERSINLSLSKNNISNYLSPENGYYISVNPSLHGAFLGGSFHYYKIDSEIKYYISLFKNIIFANRVKAGLISRLSTYMDASVKIPSFDKFHLGGQTSLRGWNSPNDFESDLLNGGTIRYLYNSELRFPLYSRLGMELFYDVGGLSDTNKKMNYEWDAGFGITINTGLGPARVDAAYKHATGRPTILFSLLYMF